MPTIRIFNIGGINQYVNPLIRKDGDLLRAVNVDSTPYGAKTKRMGYNTHLGTPDTAQVNSLFNWTKNDGTTFYNYRASGSALYYSEQGTGAWTLCGNGTISDGAHVGYAVLDDTLIIGDGAGSTRHTTNGTSFTDTSLAPIGEYFAEYQNRIYIGGTSSTLFYSTTGDATNWSTGGTADSSSFTIPGAGKINGVFKASDRQITTKNSGVMLRWDGYSLVDMSTTQGPTSPYSVAQKEGYRFWLNRDGIQGYGGVLPQLLSNAIQGQFYNNMGSAMPGGNFDTAPAEVHRYSYYLAAGTLTDDLTKETINDAIIKYDFQKNEFLNWKLANFPTAWCSYKDASGNQQLMFGDANGQCYQFSGTATTDNGSAISSVMEFFIDMDNPETDKEWRWAFAFFNPGCEAKMQIAFCDTYTRDFKRFIEIQDLSEGATEIRLGGQRSKFMFVRIYDSSPNTPYTFYGIAVDANLEPPK